jgi:hypothetical protein
MAAKFFTGLPLAGPDPECVKGNAATTGLTIPAQGKDHSHRKKPVLLGMPSIPAKPCDVSPLAVR